MAILTQEDARKLLGPSFERREANLNFAILEAKTPEEMEQQKKRTETRRVMPDFNDWPTAGLGS